MNTKWLWVMALACAIGCGAARPSAATTAREELDSQAARRARSRAPDLWALAAEATRRASEGEARGDASAAEEYAIRARALIEAAIAVSDARDLDATLRSLETRERAASVRADAAEAILRSEVEAKSLRAASTLAQEEAAKAFAEAEVDEAGRLGRKADAKASTIAADVNVISTRASLVLAASQALGASAPELDAIRAKIDRAHREPLANGALRIADEAMRDALALLGSRRATLGGPTREERDALLEAASAYGFRTEMRDEGLRVIVPKAMPSSFQRLAALALAHPNGALLVSGPVTVRGRLRAALLHGAVPEARLAETDDAVLGLSFVAYGHL